MPALLPSTVHVAPMPGAPRISGLPVTVAATSGPIATAWDVSTWPTIYVLDDEGVIRSMDDRGGHLIARVGDMLVERRTRERADSEAEQLEIIPAMRTSRRRGQRRRRIAC